MGAVLRKRTGGKRRGRGAREGPSGELKRMHTGGISNASARAHEVGAGIAERERAGCHGSEFSSMIV
jgi:hypothetical protein